MRAGEPTGLTYQGQVAAETPVLDANGSPTYDPGDAQIFTSGTPTTGTRMAWTQSNDVAGRVREAYLRAASRWVDLAHGRSGWGSVPLTIGLTLSALFNYWRAHRWRSRTYRQ